MNQRWTAQRAQDWWQARRPVRGCNYLPRTSVNDVEMWQAATFDLPTMRQELGWAAASGLDSLRVFGQFLVWDADPEGYKARWRDLLNVAGDHGLTVLPILFDDCAFAGREPHLGPQEAPRPGVHNGGWVASPGHERVKNRACWPRLAAYVSDMTRSFGADARVLAWDIYNEPSNSGVGDDSRPLVEAAFEWARAVGPDQPLTAAPWAGDDVFCEAPLTRWLFDLSDVLSFHGYDSPAGMERKLRMCRAEGRPALCSEWLARTLGNTVESVLPLFDHYNAGCYCWGLVRGKTQTHLPWGSEPGDPEPALWFHDLLHPDGRPYRAAEITLFQARS